jgi:hypothetical protein
VNIDRPDPGVCRSVSEDIVLDCLLLSRLLEEDEIDWALQRLRVFAQYNRRGLLSDGNPSFKPDLARAHAIADHLFAMYGSLHGRDNSWKKATRRETIKNMTSINENTGKGKDKKKTDAGNKGKTTLYSSMASMKKKASLASSASSASSASTSNNNLVGAGSISSGNRTANTSGETNGAAETIDASSHGNNDAASSPSRAGSAMKRFTSHGLRSVLRVKEAISKFRKLNEHGKKAEIKQQLWGKRLYETIVEGHGSEEHKSAALLEFFEAELSTVWLQCRHIALIVELFAPLGLVAKSNFGSYRVELIVMMFERITDLHNFEIILALLNSEEHAALLGRIGYLNIFNPNKCEGGWSFDLLRWEERQVAKMLIHLSVAEPGDNWWDKSFTFDRGFLPIPGWDLSKPWLTEDGLPKKGLLSFEMFAGDGLRLESCCVDVKLRQILAALVLVPQRNYVLEVERKDLLMDEKYQEFIPGEDHRSLNSVSDDNNSKTTTAALTKKINQGPKAVLAVPKLIFQIDILRYLSGGADHSSNAPSNHQSRPLSAQVVINPNNSGNNSSNVSRPISATLNASRPASGTHHRLQHLRSSNLVLGVNSLNLNHYTIDDAHDHLQKETDVTWNYVSTTKKAEMWI